MTKETNKVSRSLVEVSFVTKETNKVMCLSLLTSSMLLPDVVHRLALLECWRLCRNRYICIKRDLQQRPIYMKRDLQKRPTHFIGLFCHIVSRSLLETYLFLCTRLCQNRPTSPKRGIYHSKEANITQKRPASLKRDLYHPKRGLYLSADAQMSLRDLTASCGSFIDSFSTPQHCCTPQCWCYNADAELCNCTPECWC